MKKTGVFLKRIMAAANVHFALLCLLMIMLPASAQEPGSSTTWTPDAFARQWLEAWNSHDIDRILTYYIEDAFYEDVSNVENGWAVPMRGHQMIRESLVETFEEMSDLEFELVSASGAGDRVIVEWIMTGTHWREFTGRFSIRGVSVIKLKGDKIARVRDYYDAHVLLSQLGMVSAPDAERPVRPIAFVHVNVVPMDRERVLVDQTVLVRGGQIQEIGPTAKVELPDRAVVIEGQGKYLMPGLADMHVHLIGEEDQLALFVANGVTTVRNMFGSPEHLEWRERTKNGSLFGPTIYTTGPITDGDPPYWPGSAVVTTVEEAEKEVLAQKAAGYDGIKVFDNLQPDVYESILATAAKHDFPVYGHVPVRVGMERALGMGQKSFEHMNDFLYALMPSDDPVRVGLLEAAEDKSKVTLQTVLIQPFKSADANRIPQLVAKFVESRAWLCPTLQLLENMSSTATEFQAIRKEPGMRYAAPENRNDWDRVETGLTSKQGDPAVLKDAYKLALRSIAAMHDAGARLVAGTDTPNPFLVPGCSLHQELRQLVDAGLTPYDALKAATHDAAEFVDALDDWGTVAVGRRADLILVTGDPLEDVAHAANLTGVMLRGRWHPQAELQEKLDKLATKYETNGETETEGPE